jgi:nucleotidyltransferase substrate binding protein (TIGR01987 family)
MKNPPVLDLHSFNKAVVSLDEVVIAYEKDPQNNFLRDAAIQRFEYTFELSYKMLRRFLEISEPSAEIIDEMSFAALIRTGSEKGLLLNDWTSWKSYRQGRNLTSHTYDEEKAVSVYSIIPGFLADAKFLLQKLKLRLEEEL